MSGILVTGATGLIGRALVADLAKEGEIFATSRSIETLTSIDSAHRIPLDLSTEWDRARLPARLDAVVHLAQAENYRDFPAAAESIFKTNTASAMKLLEHARNACARVVVLASTGSVYGNRPTPFTEDEPLKMDSSFDGDAARAAGAMGFYARSRRATELLSVSYTPYFVVVVLRFFFVYGPGQKQAMLMPRLVKSVRDGAPIVLQGAEGLRCNPIHVEDAVRSVKAALGLRSSQIVNVAGPDVISMRDIGNAIAVAVGVPARFVEQPEVTPPDLVGDTKKMRSLLGEPRIRFADGVRTLV